MAIKVLQNTDYAVSHSDAVKMRGENKTLTEKIDYMDYLLSIINGEIETEEFEFGSLDGTMSNSSAANLAFAIYTNTLEDELLIKSVQFEDVATSDEVIDIVIADNTTKKVKKVYKNTYTLANGSSVLVVGDLLLLPNEILLVNRGRSMKGTGNKNSYQVLNYNHGVKIGDSLTSNTWVLNAIVAFEREVKNPPVISADSIKDGDKTQAEINEEIQQGIESMSDAIDPDGAFEELTEGVLTGTLDANKNFAMQVYKNTAGYPLIVKSLQFRDAATQDETVMLVIGDIASNVVVSFKNYTLLAGSDTLSVGDLTIESGQNLLVLRRNAPTTLKVTTNQSGMYSIAYFSIAEGASLTAINYRLDCIVTTLRKITSGASISSEAVVYGNMTQAQFNAQVENMQSSKWKGKKIVVVGDSISDDRVYQLLYNNGNALSPHCWADFMKEELGCNLVNYGSSGHYVRYDGGAGFSATVAEHNAASSNTPSFETALLGNLDADLYIIQYGINDANGNLGIDDINTEISASNRNSYCTGFNYIMNELFKANPYARVVLLTYWEKTHSDVQRNLIAAQNALAEKWGINTIAWADILGWSSISSITNATINGFDKTFGTPKSVIEIMTMPVPGNDSLSWSPDYTHPWNDKAREIMGKAVARKLNTMI